jgi:hypothetical protein
MLRRSEVLYWFHALYALIAGIMGYFVAVGYNLWVGIALGVLAPTMSFLYFKFRKPEIKRVKRKSN